MVCVFHWFIHQLKVNKSCRCGFVSRYYRTGLFAVHMIALCNAFILGRCLMQNSRSVKMFWFLSTTACVHAVWKQDQDSLCPSLSLVVPSHGELMSFFFFFNTCIYFDCLILWNVLAFIFSRKLLGWFIPSLSSEFRLILSEAYLDVSLLYCNSPPKGPLGPVAIGQSVMVLNWKRISLD